MLKIAIIAHSHHPIREPFAGGLEAHTHLICRQLSALGHQVTLFAKEGSDETDWTLRPIVAASQEFRHLPSHSLESAKQEDFYRNAYGGALDAIEQGDFDVVVNNSLNPSVLERKAALPTLTVLHLPVLPFLKEPAHRAARDELKSFVSVSNANAKQWSEVLPNVSTVLNGIDVAQWQSSVDKQDGLRWSSRISPDKGVIDAIKAAQITGRQIQIAGPISDAQFFRSEVKPLLNSDVTYVGHLSHAELVQFYASGAATVVSPQWEEPFGLIIAESLACGTPIAAYARGAIPELVTDEVGALAYEFSPQALATAIEDAVTKDSKTCASTAAQRFDYRRMVAEYEEHLTQMVVAQLEAQLCAG